MPQPGVGLVGGERGQPGEPATELGRRDSLGVEPVADWILHHHERWDGTGYPHRLSRNDIPLGARILFVADAYDAMTSDRVYRGGLSHFRALAELDRCSGTQFDPNVVEAFKTEFAVNEELEPSLLETA